MWSATRIITTLAAFAASAVDITLSPAASAFAHDLLPGYRPTTTSTPESRRFKACACPWLPYPIIATVRPFKYSRFPSFSSKRLGIYAPDISSENRLFHFGPGPGRHGRLQLQLLGLERDRERARARHVDFAIGGHHVDELAELLGIAGHFDGKTFRRGVHHAAAEDFRFLQNGRARLLRRPDPHQHEFANHRR